ncbi:uncharacterized protein JCM15063_005580 [Sporobolomyces koalae]|uniref:uncharacterized protein n=1 Tax=Sporobolomyces koalae TaxID=500713 RepID=UPI0031736680
MAEAVTNVFGTVTHFASSIPQPLSSLHQLLAAEEEDSKRIRPSATDWWVDTIRFRGSTVPRVWRAVTICTLWSVVVAVIDLVYGRNLGLTNSVTPMLSIVVGLLLVFRNSSAYSRWDTGRTNFAKMTSIVRSLSRGIWINIGAPTADKSRVDAQGHVQKLSEREMGQRAKDLQDKEKCLRLLVAFVVAAKHHLRGEYGTGYPDLEAILPHKFTEFARTTAVTQSTAAHNSTSSSASAGEVTESVSREIRRLSGGQLEPPEVPLATRRNEDLESQSSGERKPLLKKKKQKKGSQPGRGPGAPKMRRTTTAESRAVFDSYLAKPSLALPLVIAHQISLYFATCKRRNQLESVGPAGYNNLVGSVTALVDCFTTCERLVTVEIPNVYTIHLKQVVTIYLLTLPPVLVEQMGFMMIPFVSLASFMLMGVEGISSAMEMPFGGDDSDLPLDLFCAELRNEVEHTIACLPRASDEEWSM